MADPLNWRDMADERISQGCNKAEIERLQREKITLQDDYLKYMGSAQHLRTNISLLNIQLAEAQRENAELRWKVEMREGAANNCGKQNKILEAKLAAAEAALRGIKQIALIHSGSDWDNVYDYAKQAIDAAKADDTGTADDELPGQFVGAVREHLDARTPRKRR